MMRQLTLVVLLMAVVFIYPCLAEEVKTIKIGVLVDLSGPLSTYGNDIKNTLEIAKEDINKYFEEKGLPYKVEFYYEDTILFCPLEKVQSLYARGIKLIIGPMSSGEVASIKDFVTSHKMIIISPSSTAFPCLIGITAPKEKKFIFRIIPNDDFQTIAIVDELKSLGIKAVIIVYIGNGWGYDFYKCIKPKLEKAGIEIAKVVEYPDLIPANFSPYITELEKGVNNLLKKYKPSEIAIVAFSYEEVANLLAQIPDNSPLFNVLWFGCDACALSKCMIKVAKNKPKVIDVGFYSTLFDSKGPAYAELKKKYKERGYKEGPYQYALNAYDAAWILALAYVETINKYGQFDPDRMVEVIPKVAEDYSKGLYGVYPASGDIIFDEWHDRVSGSYAIWYINENAKWDKAGIWYYNNRTVKWIHPPLPVTAQPQPIVQPSPAPGIWQNYDKNSDNRIEDYELINAIMDWLNGKLSDIDLIQVILIWLKS